MLNSCPCFRQEKKEENNGEEIIIPREVISKEEFKKRYPLKPNNEWEKEDKDNPAQKAYVEATEAEKRFNDNIPPEMEKIIEKELYSAATCWALRNPKWKSDGFVEYLVNWFKN